MHAGLLPFGKIETHQGGIKCIEKVATAYSILTVKQESKAQSWDNDKDMNPKGKYNHSANKALTTVAQQINHGGGKDLPEGTSYEQGQSITTPNEEKHGNGINPSSTAKSNYSTFKDNAAD